MSGGKGEGLIVFFAPFLACVGGLKGKGNDCNAGYYRFLSPTPHPPPSITVPVITILSLLNSFFSVLIHE